MNSQATLGKFSNLGATLDSVSYLGKAGWIPTTPFEDFLESWMDPDYAFRGFSLGLLDTPISLMLRFYPIDGIALVVGNLSGRVSDLERFPF